MNDELSQVVCAPSVYVLPLQKQSGQTFIVKGDVASVLAGHRIVLRRKRRKHSPSIAVLHASFDEDRNRTEFSIPITDVFGTKWTDVAVFSSVDSAIAKSHTNHFNNPPLLRRLWLKLWPF